MSNDEYLLHMDNPTYYVDKFVECAQNDGNGMRISKKVVGVIEYGNINGADMGIELE